MRKIMGGILLLLVIALVAGACVAQDSYGMPFDDAEVYIQALEDAMDARYGGRGGWPQGFDTFLAMAKFFSGMEPAYDMKTLWVPTAAQAMEMAAFSGETDKEAATAFLWMLKNAVEPSFQQAASLPYEAKALISAAFVYSGNLEGSEYYVLPTENDLEEAEAIAIARETIREMYGLSDEEINRHEVYTVYSISPWFPSPFWGIIIGINDNGYELYYAYIASPSGEVMVATRNDGAG